MIFAWHSRPCTCPPNNILEFTPFRETCEGVQLGVVKTRAPEQSDMLRYRERSKAAMRRVCIHSRNGACVVSCYVFKTISWRGSPSKSGFLERCSFFMYLVHTKAPATYPIRHGIFVDPRRRYVRVVILSLMDRYSPSRYSCSQAGSSYLLCKLRDPRRCLPLKYSSNTEDPRAQMSLHVICQGSRAHVRWDVGSMR